MSYRGHKVVAWIPYGRCNTTRILLSHLIRNKYIVDEVWLCMNTDSDQYDDREFAELIADNDFIHLKHYGGEPLKPKQLNTGKFYKQMVDPETVYVRLDDDIVYIHDTFFENLIDFRLDNPEYFLVMAHIWNNSTISYIQQQHGHIDKECGVVMDPFAMDPIGWMNPTFAEHIHRLLLDRINKGTVDSLYFDSYELGHERFSISSFCHLGKDFAEFNGDLEGAEEEQWLTETYPAEKGMSNIICGKALVSHFAFFAQRGHLEENTTILDEYTKIGKRKLSADYYKLLDKA